MDNTNLLNRAKKCIEYNMNTAFIDERNHKLSHYLLDEMLQRGLRLTPEYVELEDIINKIDGSIDWGENDI